jgi:importin-7
MQFTILPNTHADNTCDTALQMKNGHVYQAATTSLNVEQQTLLMEIMRIADTQEPGASQA